MEERSYVDVLGLLVMNRERDEGGGGGDGVGVALVCLMGVRWWEDGGGKDGGRVAVYIKAVACFA